MIEYLDVRMEEPCGRTVPEAIKGAIGFVEGSGGGHTHQRLSLNPRVKEAVDDIAVKLTLLVGVKKVKKAGTILMKTVVGSGITNPAAW